jgi:hypothetical protein
VTTAQIIILAAFETIGIFMVVRLWLKKTRKSIVHKMVWSVLLLIPLLGPLMYGFVSVDPSAHGEDVGDHSSGGGAGDTGHH